MWWTLRCMHAMIGYCPWSINNFIVITCTCRYMDDVKVESVSLFHPTWHVVLKIWSASEGLEKCLAGAVLQVNRNRDRKRFWRLELSKLKRNIHKSWHVVSWLWKTCTFEKCFCNYSALTKWSPLNTLERNCI